MNQFILYSISHIPDFLHAILEFLKRAVELCGTYIIEGSQRVEDFSCKLSHFSFYILDGMQHVQQQPLHGQHH